MTDNYPGYSAEEIMSVAADIVAHEKKHFTDYAYECMIPAAKEQIEHCGDEYLESLGYHVSTARNCAGKIARELERYGMVTL